MQQQRSQEDSYIHKRLIANINLGACTKTKTLHSRCIYKYVNIICINTGNSRNYVTIDNLLFCLPAGLHVHPSSSQEHPVCLKMPIPSECIKWGWALFFF